MKSLIFAIASLATVSAFAQPGADIFMTRIQCKTVNNYADNSTSVNLLEGGISGIPQIQVTRSTVAGVFTNRYYAQAVNDTRAGAPEVYKGKGVTLSVNFTVAPSADNTFPGKIVIVNDKNQTTLNEALSCKLVK